MIKDKEIINMSRPVVIFADDQPFWFEQIIHTKESGLRGLRNKLEDCDFKAVLTPTALFELINELINDSGVSHIVLFLDLNFPTVKEGLEALNRISRNRDKRIREIPVYMYSVSNNPDEVSAAYSRLCQGYYHKLEHPFSFWKALSSIDGQTSFMLPTTNHLSKN